LVIGSEHEGLARNVRRACTHVAHLIAPRRIGSLNASVAAAVALYEAAVQRAKSSP
jgi:23S rRNA (guanosine2251-2'-O)-methyltransferase